jgi:hypothetical protein
MDINQKIRVLGCPLCELFNNFPGDTKLYYPYDKRDIPNSEFIIIECKTCKTPMIVYGEHIMDLNKGTYGRVLYKCKMLFGNKISINNRHRVVEDHWHIHSKEIL